MDYLNRLNYTWTYYGQELYTNPEFKCSDGYKVRYCLANWYPQGTTLKATKLDTDIWIIDSLTHYEDEDEDDYFCWFFAFVDHAGRRIFYQWIKGDIAIHTWTLKGIDKNAALNFDQGKQIISIHPIIVRARELAAHIHS